MSCFEEWIMSGQNWMGAYRKRVLKQSALKTIPAILLILIAFAVILSLVNNNGSTEEIGDAALAGVLLGIVVCLFYLLFLLPGLRPKRMRRQIQKAVKRLDMSESEQELLGREMLEAGKDPACVLDYEMVGPKSNHTPARFILSRGYACLWGSTPLVILVRLSDVAEIRPGAERKETTTYGSTMKTIHQFTLHTIYFYHKGTEISDEAADQGMGFFDEQIRDQVLSMLQEKQTETAAG